MSAHPSIRIGTVLRCVPDPVAAIRRWSHLAFEMCLQGGNWNHGVLNMAFHPAAWEQMFDLVPSPALGLEWEPCHLHCQLIDPLPVPDRWATRNFHVHGKDADINHALLAASGTHGPDWYVRHRFPGLGITGWREIVHKLHAASYTGVIDVEGAHDPLYCGGREEEGQILARDYLRGCRAKVVAGSSRPCP